MGGLGSGRPASGRNTVEGSRSIDILKLHRAGCLKPGWTGGWQWTQNGEPVAWIGLRAEEHRLVLTYHYRRGGGEWEDIEEPVPLAWQPCRFGGRRPYFVCPGVVNGTACGRRVLKLYGTGKYFLCRHCYRLSYGSQHEDRFDRAQRRANRIRRRLGGEPGTAAPFPERPKGMHHRTYDRLMDQIFEAEELADERLYLAVERLLKRDDGLRQRRR
jgi:hypothetical protein